MVSISRIGVGFFLLSVGVWAQEPVRLEDMHVRGAGSESAHVLVSGGDLARVLEDIPGLTLNSQGGAVVQNDFSIRGSSFSGAGLTVEGLSLQHPQTEHFHAELPFPSALFTVPVVLTGMDQVREASGHLAGTVALGFRPGVPGGQMHLGVGERGWNWQDGLWRVPVGEAGTVAFFSSRHTQEDVDRLDNDLDQVGGGVHGQFTGDSVQVDLAVGYQKKTFGARGYYGVNPDWDAEESFDDSMAVLAMHWVGAGAGRVQGTFAYRITEDRYQLFLPHPPVYENEHTTSMRAVSLSGHHDVSRHGLLDWRVSGESEALDSSGLGDHDRRRASGLVLPGVASGSLKIFGGARVQVFSESEPDFLPQASGLWEVARHQTVFVSYTERVREPSYTELNYASPGSLGNEGLENETLHGEEVGWRFTGEAGAHVSAVLFRNVTRHTVDWVKADSDSTRWVATDLGAVETQGLELMGVGRTTRDTRVALSYTFIQKEDAVDVYAGRYVLDYPEHVFHCRAVWDVRPWCEVQYSQTLRWQSPTEARAGDDFGNRGDLLIRLDPKWWPGAQVSVVCDNLWNDTFEFFVGQPVVGRRFSMAVTLGW